MKSNRLRQIAEKYINFQIEGKKVQIPYCIVFQPGELYDADKVARTTRFEHYGAKGRPEQIKAALRTLAEQKKIDLKKASQKDIQQLMLSEGLGIDCSGFVYTVLSDYLNEEYSIDLGQQIVRFPGLLGKIEQKFLSKNRIRRCSAKTLTSNLNTTEVKTAAEVRAGDLLRLSNVRWSGKHIAIVIEVTDKVITYAHSSEGTEHLGPHYAEIKITHPTKGLEHQNWREMTKFGTPYKDEAYKFEDGDSVRRLFVLR